MTMKRRSFIRGVAAAAFGAGLGPKSAQATSLLFQNSLETSSAFPGEVSHNRDFFYKPTGGRVGDVIPFYDGKQFRIFHLYKADHDQRGTTWHQVSTNDFVHFIELGEMLPRGTPDDQDLSVATGSVVRGGGRYHIFYTGYNSPRKASKPEQGVMHAVSDDLVKWEKVPEDTFYAPQDRYERDDWRDPFVFWNAEAHEYWMLVAARLKKGPRRRRGCTALCVSKDLSHWEVRDPFWAPGLYFTHECPDLFQMGEWWYLIFSEFSETNQTRYRMSRKSTGPWLTPEIDTFDSRALYAAKTASDGHRRFLFGWNPLRQGDSDDGKWEWGGNLVVHELVQQPNGTLSVKIPETIDQAFSSNVALQSRSAIGDPEIAQDHVAVQAPDSFSAATIAPMLRRCRIAATIDFAAGTRFCGLMLKLADDLDSCYYLRLEPARQRVVFDRWPRPGDIPFMPGFERPIKLDPGEPVSVEVIVDDTIAVICVAGTTVLSTRMYSQNFGQCAVFVQEGSATFRNPGLFSMGEGSRQTKS